MNHKASATCANGHTVEWGPCKGQVKKLFGSTKECGMKGFEQVYADGPELTVSFGRDRWIAVRCTSCGAKFDAKPCPICGVVIPVSAFEKKGLFAKLG